MPDYIDLSPDMVILDEHGPQWQPIDAKALAIDVLRVCFDIELAEGAIWSASGVRELLKEMGVERFILVPDERDRELLERALGILAELAAHYPEDAARNPMQVGEGRSFETGATAAEPFLRLAVVA
jgi:hypothetical protein